MNQTTKGPQSELFQSMTKESNKSSDPDVMLALLLQAAREVGVDVRFEFLDDDEVNISSGLCYVKNKPSLIIDKRLDDSEKVVIVANHLKEFDLDHLYLPPALRDWLDARE